MCPHRAVSPECAFRARAHLHSYVLVPASRRSRTRLCPSAPALVRARTGVVSPAHLLVLARTPTRTFVPAPRCVAGVRALCSSALTLIGARTGVKSLAYSFANAHSHVLALALCRWRYAFCAECTWHLYMSVSASHRPRTRSVPDCTGTRTYPYSRAVVGGTCPCPRARTHICLLRPSSRRVAHVIFRTCSCPRAHALVRAHIHVAPPGVPVPCPSAQAFASARTVLCHQALVRTRTGAASPV
ncbi:hypothetical protein C8R44DRAFT_872393 [Mycena epipterygia]|nr:hypothetical protein C8R44DRAFT_872393 [Mycena epipterygia]